MSNASEIAKELTVAYISKLQPNQSGADIMQRTQNDAERIAKVYTIIFEAVSKLVK